MQILESYKVKLTIGIEKYTQLKTDLANAVKEKKAMEKEFTKKVEKYDHTIAKLKDKNYKLKDQLEDKENEVEKLESKLNKLKEFFGYETEEDDEQSEEDSEDESNIDMENHVCQHTDTCELLQGIVDEIEKDAKGDDFDDNLFISEDARSDDEEEEGDDIDVESTSPVSEEEDLEDVIQDMTEQFCTRIEELENKLKEKDEKLAQNRVQNSESETTQTDDDNLSSTTEYGDTLTSSQDSDEFLFGFDDEIPTLDGEGTKRDINNNIIEKKIEDEPQIPSGMATENVDPVVEAQTPTAASGEIAADKELNGDLSNEELSLSNNPGDEDDIPEDKSNPEVTAKVFQKNIFILNKPIILNI